MNLKDKEAQDVASLTEVRMTQIHHTEGVFRPIYLTVRMS